MTEELKAKVLIVDDEEQFLKAFSKRLEMRGMKIETATSGEEALGKVQGKDFDAIILDLVMPGIGGMETLKRLKEENPDLQIIILTGHGTIERGVEAIKAGALDFVEKPADINKILEKIGEAKHKRVVLFEKRAEEHIQEIVKTRSW
ncbi:MAG: response regulator [Desulfatiglandales bacterium]